MVQHTDNACRHARATAISYLHNGCMGVGCIDSPEGQSSLELRRCASVDGTHHSVGCSHGGCSECSDEAEDIQYLHCGRNEVMAACATQLLNIALESAVERAHRVMTYYDIVWGVFSHVALSVDGYSVQAMATPDGATPFTPFHSKL